MVWIADGHLEELATVRRAVRLERGLGLRLKSAPPHNFTHLVLHLDKGETLGNVLLLVPRQLDTEDRAVLESAVITFEAHLLEQMANLALGRLGVQPSDEQCRVGVVGALGAQRRIRDENGHGEGLAGWLELVQHESLLRGGLMSAATQQ